MGERVKEHVNVNQDVNGKELLHLVPDNLETNPIEQTQMFTRPHLNKLNDVPCLLIRVSAKVQHSGCYHRHEYTEI